MAFVSIPGLSDSVAPIPFVSYKPAVNSIQVFGLEAPGKWTLIDAVREFDWLLAGGFGLSGGAIMGLKVPPLVVKFRVELWDNQDFAAFNLFSNQVLSNPAFRVGGSLSGALPGAGNLIPTAAFPVGHPEVQRLGALAFVVKSYSALIQDENGLWHCDVRFLEYRKPIPVPPVPKFVIPGVKTPPPAPRTAKEIEAEKLLKEIETQKGKLGI